MFQFCTIVMGGGDLGLASRILERSLMAQPSYRRAQVGGNRWITTWLPAGVTVVTFSTGQGVADYGGY